MLEVSGIVSVPRKARRVLVPMDIFASKVSAPPKTLRIRAEAVYNRVRSWRDRKKRKDTHRTAFIVPQLRRA